MTMENGKKLCCFTITIKAIKTTKLTLLVDDYIDKYVGTPHGEEEDWYDYGGRQRFAESLRSDSKLVAQKVRYLDHYDRPIFYFLCKIYDKGCLVRWDFTKNDDPTYPVKPLWGDLKDLKSRHYDR